MLVAITASMAMSRLKEVIAQINTRRSGELPNVVSALLSGSESENLEAS